MILSRHLRHLAASIVLSILAATAPRAQPAVLAIRHASVVDVTDGSIHPNQTVVVEGHRIAAVGADERTSVPQNARVVDATGGYLIPGLWDMHVHVTDATELALPVLLANGVTGVRDCGGNFSLLRRFERERIEGERTSPRIVMAGPYVDSDKGLPYRLVVETAAEGRAAADSLSRMGVDFIKVHNGVPRAAFFALLDRAHEQGIKVVGHIPLGVWPWEAVRAGQAGVEHYVSLFEGPLRERFGADPEGGMNDYVASGLDTLMTLFAARHVWFTPTAYTYWLRAERGRLAQHPDPRVRYVASSLRRQWDAYYPVQQRDSVGAIVAARERFYRIGLDVIRVAHEAGVDLLAGTDLAARDVLPGFTLHDELAAMVEAGLAPYEALQTATLNAARFLGRTDDLGTITPGNMADLVLLDADPLDDIHNTRRISGVVADGRYYDRDALDEMLLEAERRASQQ